MGALSSKRWLVVAARLFLGFVFVYAAYHKIDYPPGFAKEIVPYGLMPTALVNLWAIYLPWVELLTGVALILGIWSRTAGILTIGMLLMFLFAIGTRFARGEFDFDCGCFAHEPSAIDDIPVLGQLKWFFFSSPKAYVTFARDLVFLALGIFIVAAHPRPAATPARAAGADAVAPVA